MEKNRPRSPTINSHRRSATGHAHPPSRTCPPPPGRHVTLNLHAQSTMFHAWANMGPGGGGGRPETGLSTDAPRPRPSCGRPGGGSGSRGCPGWGTDPGATDVHARGRAGWEPGGTCGMVVHGRGIVGSIRRVCFSTSSSLNRTSSIWRVTNLVDLGHASSSRRDRPRPQSMPALSPAR